MLYRVVNNRLIRALFVVFMFMLSLLAESYLWILKKARGIVIFPGN
ncbi:hypothetical protein ACFL0P_02340 [Candidatus Omnitrophota bacterium]